jgi:hypothetical protein
MNGRERFFPAGLRDRLSQPFISALLGGLVVLVAAAIAIDAGWIGEERKTTVVQDAPLGEVSSEPSGKLTIGDIYDRDGPGVVFIRAEIEQRIESPFGLFPQRQRSLRTRTSSRARARSGSASPATGPPRRSSSARTQATTWRCSTSMSTRRI